VYTEALGPAAYIGRARVVPLRNTGAAISPFNAFLILQGIETLSLRIDRISDSALQIAQHLKAHPRVAWVNYAGLEDHPDHALVNKYLSGKASGLLTFGLKGPLELGRERGARFLDALQLFTRLVNIGDVRSLATHPASTTHRQLSPSRIAASRRIGGHGAPVDRPRAHQGLDRGSGSGARSRLTSADHNGSLS
jgi:O-acetylhomoserine (thiol)-lyase